MRSYTRLVAALLAGIVCLLALGAIATRADAATASRAKANRTRLNVHRLQVALVSYAVDNDGLYPRFVSNSDFRELLHDYAVRWFVNPYSGHSMRQKRSAGNFTYATYHNLTRFRLIGWGPRERPLVIVRMYEGVQ